MFRHATHRMPPGPSGDLLFGHLRTFLRDPVHSLLDASSEFGDVVSLRWGWHPMFLLNRPEHIQHVLQSNSRNYGRGLGYPRMRSLLGNGILTSEGEHWLRHRRVIQRSMHTQRLHAIGQIVSAATAQMLERWRQYAEIGQSFDVVAEMIQLTNYIIGHMVFGIDLNSNTHSLGGMLAIVVSIVHSMTTAHTRSIPAILGGLGLLPSWQTRQLRTVIADVDAMIYQLIAERRRSREDRGDLLSVMLAARDEQGEQYLNDQQIRDELLTMFLAGKETTATALGWTWYLLSQHPEVDRRMRVEIGTVLRGRPATPDDLSHLPFTKTVLLESLRLYPPIWMTLRTAVAHDVIGGWHIPAGAGIIISPFVTQRSPDFWGEPDAFIPERFATEYSNTRPRYSYFPFGGGMRQCIGEHLAMFQAQLVIATVAQRYRLQLEPGHPVELDPSISLRARHGIHVTLAPEKGTA